MKAMSLSYAPGMFRFVDRTQQFKIRLMQHQLNLLLATQHPVRRCHREAPYNQFPWKWRDPIGFRAHLQASPPAPLRLLPVLGYSARTDGPTSS